MTTCLEHKDLPIVNKNSNKDDQYHCRFCSSNLKYTFVDLGMSPIANEMLPENKLNSMEPFYPLHVYVCDQCFLVQLPEHQNREAIFNDHYTYFSSYSDSWLKHVKKYVDMMTKRFSYSEKSLVVELASNDGYLLQYFKEKNIPVLGIEPAGNAAQVAIDKGIPSLVKFFGENTAIELAKEKKSADLIIAINVLAHVPDINDFVLGMKKLLKPTGVINVEFPHLMSLMDFNQFDTIYHEHFSYFSLSTVNEIFRKHQLKVFDVQKLESHGGSIRIFATHINNSNELLSDNLKNLLLLEEEQGFRSISRYLGYQDKVNSTKRKLLDFLIEEKSRGKTIVAYGAPAKGNTLLNYCGIHTDLVDYTVDKSPYKQGMYLPGVHIPVYDPKKIFETKPDYVLILPWNLRIEISEQMKEIRDWSGKFVVTMPALEIF